MAQLTCGRPVFVVFIKFLCCCLVVLVFGFVFCLVVVSEFSVSCFILIFLTLCIWMFDFLSVFPPLEFHLCPVIPMFTCLCV